MADVAAAPSAPVSTPAPAIPAPPSEAAVPPAGSSIESSIAELNSTYGGEAKLAPAKSNGNGKPAKAIAKPADKPVEKAPEKPTDPLDEEYGDDGKVAEKPAEPAKVEANGKPAEAAPAEGKRPSPWQLVHKYEGELKELKKQLEEKSKPVDDVEKKSLLEYKAKLEERTKQLEEELEYSSFERSDKYKIQYETPFVDAFVAGRNKASSVKVSDGNGSVRQGTPEDFDAIMRITDDDAAADRATELFGAKAPLVLFHVERVKELNAAKNKAIEDYRTKGGERFKKAQEEHQTTQRQHEEQAKALADEFTNARKAAIEKFEWLKPKEGADARNQALSKELDLVDRAFSDGQPLKEGQKPLSGIELAKLRAAMANKAVGFAVFRHEYKEAQAKISELEEKLKQYEESEPGKDAGRRGDVEVKHGSVMDQVTADLIKRAGGR